MKPSTLLEQLPELLLDWIPPTASVAIACGQKYVAYHPGAVDLRIAPGESVRPGSIAHLVFSYQHRVESEVDADVFGVPYYGLGYPLQSEQGVESAVAVILPPKRKGGRQPLSYVVGKTGQVWRPIPVQDIAYFESYEKKTWFYTKDGRFSTEHTLRALEQHLPNEHFLRIHRSYMIHIGYIDSIERDDRSNLNLVMAVPNKTRLSVAQTYVRRVRTQLGF
ncbi:LytR/AlgR family response regulator transcription factor [Alicyclobacillus suci]|uniref:LytR/AlgR family response regulator transcription factor n=1 Tax=Alicyclobacillus suci TaxID=2816080 RepID=UPI001A8FB6E0|nr:LytTR family DNA-binding domain-containing protein [Alicyclobacillus suci]